MVDFVRKSFNFRINQSFQHVFEDENTGRKWWGDNRPALGVAPLSSSIDPGFYQTESVERGTWASGTELMLSCIGLSVGLVNIWRFPYLVYENGGVVFLFVYIVIQIMVGIPMYILELTIGQFSGKGPTKIWDMTPCAKGIGLSMCMLSLFGCVTYNVVMAYTLEYFVASMHDRPPWLQCLDKWVSEHNCVPKRIISPKVCTENVAAMEKLGSCTCTGNRSLDSALSFTCTESEVATTAAELYFYKTVLQRSQGLELEHMGWPIPQLTLYLFLCWMVVVFCMIEGIKSSGKVVTFTATFPYLIMFALLIRGLFLDGAAEGLRFFFMPEWGRLVDFNTWVMAANLVFTSLGVSAGGIVTFGSYSKFSYSKIFRDAVIISMVDLATSFFGGLVVFTTIGAMAEDLGMSVEKVAHDGYNLAFVVYPEALAQMPYAQIWSMLFFFMLFTLGVDAEFALFETILTSIQDEYPYMRAYKGRLCMGAGLVCFLLGLPLVCPGGDYMVTLMRLYGIQLPIVFICLVEVLTIMYVYSYDRLWMDIEYMIGVRPQGWQYLELSWTIFCPAIIAVILIYQVFNFESPKYPDGRPFPWFAQLLGCGFALVVLCPMPLWLAYMKMKSYVEDNLITTTDRQEFLFSPNIRWKPHDDLPHPVIYTRRVSGT